VFFSRPYLPSNSFTVDSVLTPIAAELGENGMKYSRDFKFNKDQNMLTVTTKFQNGIVTYAPENYQNIRDFYTNILKDNNRNITIRRVSAK